MPDPHKFMIRLHFGVTLSTHSPVRNSYSQALIASVCTNIGRFRKQMRQLFTSVWSVSGGIVQILQRLRQLWPIAHTHASLFHYSNNPLGQHFFDFFRRIPGQFEYFARLLPQSGRERADLDRRR